MELHSFLVHFLINILFFGVKKLYTFLYVTGSSL